MAEMAIRLDNLARDFESVRAVDGLSLEVPAGLISHQENHVGKQRFLFHSAPWLWGIYMALTLPLRYGRIQQLQETAPHLHPLEPLTTSWNARATGSRRAAGQRGQGRDWTLPTSVPGMARPSLAGRINR